MEFATDALVLIPILMITPEANPCYYILIGINVLAQG